MEVAALREKLERAFPDAPYPEENTLTECDCPECREITEYFRGKTWQGHTVKQLRWLAAALNLMTAEAVHHFLPAFVLAELEDPEEADIIYNSLVFIFTPSGSSRYKQNIALLTKAQREAMTEYFRYCLVLEGEYRVDDDIPNAIAALAQEPFCFTG